MNLTPSPNQPRTLIVIDEELLTALRTTLEATRLELVRLQQKETGSEPLTLKDAAKYLHVSYSTLKEYLRKQEIVASEYGGRVWVTRGDLDVFILRNRRKVQR